MMIRILGSVAVAAVLALSYPALAAEGHDHGKEHSHDEGHSHGAADNHFSVKAPETVKDAWALITTKVSETETALSAKNIDTAHEASEHLHAAVHTLESKPDAVPAESQTKLSSVLKQLDKAVDELHHGAEDKNVEAAEAALTKFKGLLPLVEGLYPAGTLN